MRVSCILLIIRVYRLYRLKSNIRRHYQNSETRQQRIAKYEEIQSPQDWNEPKNALLNMLNLTSKPRRPIKDKILNQKAKVKYSLAF